MIESFIFLPIALLVGFLAFHFHLSYITYSILIAISILVFDLIRGRNGMFEPQVGYGFLALGFALLLFAYFVSNNYSISFDELDHAKYLPKIVRHLPSLSIASITMGTVIVIRSFFYR